MKASRKRPLPADAKGEKVDRLAAGAPSGATALSAKGHVQNRVHTEAAANHVESFNAFVESGLEVIREGLGPTVVETVDNDPISISLTELTLSKPNMAYQQFDADAPAGDDDARSRCLPSHCRLGHLTYAGELFGRFVCRVGSSPHSVDAHVSLGLLPIMVRSKVCHLNGLSKKQLVACKEDETDVGGYFILNGLERVIRMLLMPRANFPMAIIRNSYKSRGPLYTGYATLLRCMRLDGGTLTNTLHYCRDGSVFLRFSHTKQEWLIPFVLVAKCLHDVSDGTLLELLAGPAASNGGAGGGIYLQERAFVLLQQQNAKQPIASQRHARRLLGSTFRAMLGSAVPGTASDEEVGAYIGKKFFLVHTEDSWEKLQTFCIMYQKLIALVRNEIEPDNQDAFSSHELLLPGQLYGMVVKENLEMMMQKARVLVKKYLRKDDQGKSSHTLQEFIEDNKLLKAVMTWSASDVGRCVEGFLSTGNIASRSGLDLQQTSGYTIVADKLNTARFSSHFVATHRGQYFAEMKTTTVRKLLPETWGFLCPVHTPDGAPCGLLNHLANSCKGVTKRYPPEVFERVVGHLAALGAEISCGASESSAAAPTFAAGAGVTRAWITLDGRPVGHVSFEQLEQLAQEIRSLKVDRKQKGVPQDMEIVCISKSWKHLFPGLYLFLAPSRLVRPVRCLRTGKVEYIGPIEQLFLNVAALGVERHLAGIALTDGINSGEEIPEQLPVEYSHEELRPTEIFSLLASLTPFSNHNQSPRNMYQCQMLKQTMGTPYHNHVYRSDNKVYRILTPQKPIVRTSMYESAECDAHPQGTNAVVAVITYTGYDMEDAMIINKGAYHRGFGNGVVYKTKIVEAGPKSLRPAEQHKCHFSNVIRKGGEYERICKELDDKGHYRLDDDGLPRIGVLLKKGDPICCYLDADGKPTIEHYKDEEPAFIEHVTRIDGSCRPAGTNKSESMKVSIRLRLPRRPMVGDKFSSRHGQKGVMSILWPSEDMPFSDSGITPDILFNPHGFPSRMTIGMLIESIAGKTAACEGRPTANASTFRSYHGTYGEKDNNEDDPFLEKALAKGDVSSATTEGPAAAEYFGRTLAKHGFQRLGTERMYSGVHGTEMETEIFLGVVYYQRLRHMVAEKAQVRARGAVDKVTMQPVKGRKKHGGIRFGEMERDSLLAHGASFLLHDRLMRSSDYDIGFVCPNCGSVLTPQANTHMRAGTVSQPTTQWKTAGEPWECPPCSKKAGKVVYCHPMPVPWVYRYLSCEMAAMNIKMQVRLTNRGREASLSSPAFGEAALCAS